MFTSDALVLGEYHDYQAIQCELPVMDMAAQAVFVRLRFTETPSELALAALNDALSFVQYTFVGLNVVALEVVPRPYLSSVLPSRIYNLVGVKRLNITGERFEQTGSALKCQVASATSPSINWSVTAIF
jgi:hypothetical protein